MVKRLKPQAKTERSEGSYEKDQVYCVVLHVVEGINFYVRDLRDCDSSYAARTREQIIMNAALNTVDFEIEGAPSATAETIIFNSNCIWECDMPGIKRIKTDNRPVKVTFYTCSPASDRRTIGTLLLPVRGLPVVNTACSNMALQLKMFWHKLICISNEFRSHKPEVLLMLAIIKKSLLRTDEFEHLMQFTNRKSPRPPPLQSPGHSITANMLQSQANVYVQSLVQLGLLQVGNDPLTDCDIIEVVLQMKELKNVHKLVKSLSAANPTNTPKEQVVLVVFDFVGNVTNIELKINEVDSYPLNDVLGLRFKSSLRMIRLYFQRIFYLPINMYYNGAVIASYRMDFGKLLPADTYFNETPKYVRNGLFVFDRFGRMGSARDLKPIMEYTFTVDIKAIYSRQLSHEAAAQLQQQELALCIGNSGIIRELPKEHRHSIDKVAAWNKSHVGLSAESIPKPSTEKKTVSEESLNVGAELSASNADSNSNSSLDKGICSDTPGDFRRECVRKKKFTRLVAQESTLAPKYDSDGLSEECLIQRFSSMVIRTPPEGPKEVSNEVEIDPVKETSARFGNKPLEDDSDAEILAMYESKKLYRRKFNALMKQFEEEDTEVTKPSKPTAKNLPQEEGKVKELSTAVVIAKQKLNSSQVGKLIEKFEVVESEHKDVGRQKETKSLDPDAEPNKQTKQKPNRKSIKLNPQLEPSKNSERTDEIYNEQTASKVLIQKKIKPKLVKTINEPINISNHDVVDKIELIQNLKTQLAQDVKKVTEQVGTDAILVGMKKRVKIKQNQLEEDPMENTFSIAPVKCKLRKRAEPSSETQMETLCEEKELSICDQEDAKTEALKRKLKICKSSKAKLDESLNQNMEAKLNGPVIKNKMNRQFVNAAENIILNDKRKILKQSKRKSLDAAIETEALELEIQESVPLILPKKSSHRAVNLSFAMQQTDCQNPNDSENTTSGDFNVLDQIIDITESSVDCDWQEQLYPSRSMLSKNPKTITQDMDTVSGTEDDIAIQKKCHTKRQVARKKSELLLSEETDTTNDESNKKMSKQKPKNKRPQLSKAELSLSARWVEVSNEQAKALNDVEKYILATCKSDMDEDEVALAELEEHLQRKDSNIVHSRQPIKRKSVRRRSQTKVAADTELRDFKLIELNCATENSEESSYIENQELGQHKLRSRPKKKETKDIELIRDSNVLNTVVSSGESSFIENERRSQSLAPLKTKSSKPFIKNKSVDQTALRNVTEDTEESHDSDEATFEKPKSKKTTNADGSKNLLMRKLLSRISTIGDLEKSIAIITASKIDETESREIILKKQLKKTINADGTKNKKIIMENLITTVDSENSKANITDVEIENAEHDLSQAKKQFKGEHAKRTVKSKTKRKERVNEIEQSKDEGDAESNSVVSVQDPESEESKLKRPTNKMTVRKKSATEKITNEDGHKNDIEIRDAQANKPTKKRTDKPIQADPSVDDTECSELVTVMKPHSKNPQAKVTTNTEGPSLESQQQISRMEVTVHMYDETLNQTAKTTHDTSKCSNQSVNTDPVKFVDTASQELEDWKQRHSELFKNELNRKEQLHLCNLEQQKSEQHEADCAMLGANIKKVADLEQTLHNVQRKLSDNVQSSSNEPIIAIDYETKFAELDQHITKLKEEMELQLQLFESRNQEMREENTQLAMDKDQLKERIRQMEAQIAQMRSQGVDGTDLKQVLCEMRAQNERFLDMSKSKDHYKKQWRRCAKRVHALKLAVFENNVQHEKKTVEVNFLNLKNILTKDAAEFEREFGQFRSTTTTLSFPVNSASSHGDSLEPPLPDYLRGFPPAEPTGKRSKAKTMPAQPFYKLSNMDMAPPQ